MARDSHPSVSIEGHTVRTWLGSTVGLGPRVPARVHEYRSAFAGDPLDDVVRWNLGKQQRAVARPHRTLGPLVEAAGYLFELRVLGNDLVECRIEPLNLLTGCKCRHERRSYYRCTEPHARDCTLLSLGNEAFAFSRSLRSADTMGYND